VRDIAKLANVSVGTVDRALNNRVGISPKTRKHILEISQRLGYSPNLTTRALSFGESALRVGLCIPREIHYLYDQIHAGFIDEAQRHQHIGLQTFYRPVKNLQSPLKPAVRELLDSKVDADIVTPGQARQAAPLIAELEQEHNVRVVCVASDDSQSARSTAVCVDPVVNGSVAAELMAKLTPAGAKVAVLTGNFDTEDHTAKVRAFSSRFPIECWNGRIVETIEGFEDEEEVRRKTVRLLRTYDDLAGIYITTVNCMPVCQAVEAAGKSGKLRIISTDVFPEVSPFFIRNTLSAAIYQHPFRQGQLALQLIVDHFVTGRPFPLSFYLNPVIALRSNLTLFREMRSSVESGLMESY
jgi:LacI family transcriptional regulator